MIAHSQESDDTRHHKTDDSRNTYRYPQFSSCPISNAAQDAGHCIDFLMKNHWFIVQKHIANHATSRSSNTTHDDCHPKSLSSIKTALDARNGKEG